VRLSVIVMLSATGQTLLSSLVLSGQS